MRQDNRITEAIEGLRVFPEKVKLMESGRNGLWDCGYQ